MPSLWLRKERPHSSSSRIGLRPLWTKGLPPISEDGVNNVMITNDPIPADASIERIERGVWDGRPLLVTRFRDAAGKFWTRMEWVDELDSRPDSLTNYLHSTPELGEKIAQK